jgi:23S rRNA (cytosine1962-C5)-methyltransferase
LFAYSGVGSILMAKAGAKVCHLDAAKGMIAWGKESLALNPDIPSNIRWITDDVIKFLNREIKRGRKYNGVILDPPSYGRGAQGQIWKIEDNINELLELVADVVDKTGEFFIVISAHTPGFSPIVLERLLKHHFLSKKNEYTIESGEMGVLEDSDSFIPAGNFAKIVVKTT